jgi:DNA-binding CsgD family transcriptional regulator
MRLVRSAVPLVETIYGVDLPAASWLESIRRAAERSFTGHVGVQSYIFRISCEGRFELEGIASDPALEAVFHRAHDLAGPEVIKKIYLRKPLVSLRRAVVGSEHDSGYQEVIGSGIGNIVLALGVDPGGLGCALVFAQRSPATLSRPARQILERVSAHLSSARRLRTSTSGDESSGCRDDAIVTAHRGVLHAERDARHPDARRALREAARRVDLARSRHRQIGVEEALALWRSLVEGRWSLVERFDSDGRRLFVARRNDPTARRTRALGENERKVVALLAVGHSIKLCAYELGFAQSTASDLAHCAMRKLGVSSRAELVDLHGAIIAPNQATTATETADRVRRIARRTTHG